MYQQSTSTDARLEKNEYVLSLNSGVEIPVDINISKIVVGEKAVYMLMIRDIRQQQATEREILNAVIETEERERKRFSTDLHDTIGPLLSALNLYITALNRSTTSERHNEAFMLAKETLNETLKSIREISNNLSPQSLTDFGLGVALKNFVQRLNLDENLQINLDINLGATRLPAHLEVGFYRIATELINNTMKYANASLIHLEVYTYNHFAKLDYRDNGIGFSSQEVAAKGGHGIPNISSRVRSMNGKFRLWSRKGKGVRITVETPIYTPNAV
jgi:signal transduction histidine kinase